MQRLYRTDHDLKLDHFALVVELDEIDALELPSADIGRKFQCGVVGAGDEAAVVRKILEKSAPRLSAPAKSRRGRGSAIARWASETHYVPRVAAAGFRDAGSDETMPGFQGVVRQRR